MLLSGCASGLASSFIVAPVEHTRIRMQIQGTMAVKQYSGAFNAGQQIAVKYGIRGLYKGFVGTLVRDSMFKAIFFTSNDLIMKAFHGNSTVINPTYAFIAGGLTGIVSWLAIFPLDSLKSIQQTESLDHKKYSGYTSMVQTVLKEQGVAKLYRGLGVCLLRSFPVNAVTFMLYNLAKTRLVNDF